MMDEQMQPQEQPTRRKWTAEDRKVFLLTLAGTVGTGEALSLIAHAGWGGAAFAAAAATIIAKSSPDLYQGIKDYMPWTDLQNSVSSIVNHREPGSRSIADRALGRHPNLEEQQTTIAPSIANQTTQPMPAIPSAAPVVDVTPIIGPMIAIPQAPRFSEMCHLITPHRLVLCWTVEGPVFGTVEDLLSMAIIGKPGRGKTTALIYYVAMLLKCGAEVHVWDPHGSMSELDGAFTNLHYTDDLADIPGSMDRLRTELESRRKLYKQGKRVKRPLLLLVDELPVIGEYSKTFRGEDAENSPVKLISDFVLQARKWNCYFIGAGQSTDAEILPTRVTENLSSRIVFYSSPRRATMAGIDLETAKKYLPVLKPDDIKGKMIFDCSRIAEPILGAIPYITIADVQRFLGQDELPVTRSVDHQSDLFDEDDEEEEEQDELEQPVQKATTLDSIMALYLADKIDDALFRKLVDALPSNTGKVSSEEVKAEPLRLVPQQPAQPVLSPELQRALEVYRSGYNTARPLGEQLGCGKTKAAELINDLEELGLIEKRKRV